MQSRPEFLHDGRVAHVRVEGALVTLRDDLEAVRASSDASVIVLDLRAATGPAAALDWLERFELPVVCAFESPLRDAAAGLALACDIRICGEHASITPPPTAHARLRRLLRDPDALDRAVRGETFTAVEALSCGMVSKVTAA
ncbi:MAG TPA: hypothetical protein VJQ83_01720, partial [Tepidiformaceae bacterium]|nr:hypothetical protein [Tepidiformaceae bacterium]